MYASNTSARLALVATLIDQGHLDQVGFFQTLQHIEAEELPRERYLHDNALDMVLDQTQICIERTWGPSPRNVNAIRRLRELKRNGKLTAVTINWFVVETDINVKVLQSEVA